MPEAEQTKRLAVVSGGTRGIGEGIARALAADGWRVVAGSDSARDAGA